MDFIKDLNIDKVRNLAEDAFNKVKPKTDVEARVYEVLSHENWGSSTTLMNEIAQDTFDYERFLIVTKLMWEAIENQRPAAWRVIFKGLTLLEHLVKNGSERCVDDARNHSHLLRSLDKFNYYEGTVDRGVGVREKSKQLVEMLGDDERIREERMKARQLREKFAGRPTATSSSGAAGSKYSGYGNSDAAWSAGSGRAYGESGIGASNRRDTSNQAYAGRYGEGGIESTRTANPKPAKAAPVSDAPKKSPKVSSPSTAKVKKLKKKEQKSEGATPSAAEVDLFSFDAPPSEPVKAADDQFDAFQHAPPAANDDFGDFQEIAPSSAVQFDAFGTSAPAPPQVAFDAFGTGSTPNSMQQSSSMRGNQMQMGNMNSMNNAFGNMNLQNHPTTPANNVSVPAADSGDDFGDFEGADLSSAKSPQKSSDPLSKLISLDGLAKNMKKEDRLSKPVNSNDAAAQFAHDQKTNPNQGVTHSSFGFQGIDGLSHTPDLMAKGKSVGTHPHGQPIMGGGQQGEVGAKIISMMGPMIGGANQGQGMMQGGGMNMGMMNQPQQGMVNMGPMGGQPPQMGIGGMGMGMGMMNQQGFQQNMSGGFQHQQQQQMSYGGQMGQMGGQMGQMGQQPMQQGMGMGNMGTMGGQPQQMGMGIGMGMGMGMGNMGSMGGQPQQMGMGMGMGGMGMMNQQQQGMGNMGTMGANRF